MKGSAVRKKSSLPYTWRVGLTVDSRKYDARVRCDIEQMRQTFDRPECIARLLSILGRSVAGSEDFEIERRRARDGPTLHVSKWKVQDPAHVVVYANGLESHAGWFSEAAGELAERRIAVYGVDRRGSGLNARIAGTWRDWVDDLAGAAQSARHAHPGARVHAASLCFGAAAATALSIQHPRAVDSLIYMSPGLHVKVHPTPHEMLRVVLNRLPGLACNIPSPVRVDEMFTDSPKALWFLHRDKLRTVAPRADDFFEAKRILRYVMRHLGEVHVPCIVFLAGKDRVVDNAATRRTFLQFGCKPRIVEYPDSEHILFFGAAKERLISDIVDFIT